VQPRLLYPSILSCINLSCTVSDIIKFAVSRKLRHGVFFAGALQVIYICGF